MEDSTSCDSGDKTESDCFEVGSDVADDGGDVWAARRLSRLLTAAITAASDCVCSNDTR